MNVFHRFGELRTHESATVESIHVITLMKDNFEEYAFRINAISFSQKDCGTSF